MRLQGDRRDVFAKDQTGAGLSGWGLEASEAKVTMAFVRASP